MANPIDAYYDRLVDSVTANRQRMESYKTLYNENHAYRLANGSAVPGPGYPARGFCAQAIEARE
jgi:hypothetical protein